MLLHPPAGEATDFEVRPEVTKNGFNRVPIVPIVTNNGAVLKARPMTRNQVVEEVNCLGKGVEDFVHVIVYLVSTTQVPCEKNVVR